ncbi:MAG: hypothetical protein ACK4G4_10350 [Thermus sp.]|uniref:Type II methyltransferase M.Eco57I C-terminal domain-containing protein n=1 Tax=Thermus tengchongensis TaxID=1214928 RepID=A0A4Y9FDQ1_9DEIN|nr:hypothetical protein [Thermus tengchongensis]TFU26258.1 hypothetical protein E0687_06565 [Thermus tengchongensis]
MKAPEVVRQGESTRVVTKTAAELFQEGLEKGNKYSGGKWGGLYLRAPDIYFRILEKAGDKLVRLGDVAEVRFGIKTGANDFFYLEVLPYRPVCPLCEKVHKEALAKEEEAAYWARGERPPENALVAVKNGAGWEGYLEASCLRPVIVSPKHSKTYGINPSSLPKRVLWLDDHLPPHATAYVNYGKDQGKSALREVSGSEAGYRIGASRKELIVYTRVSSTRHQIFLNERRVEVDNNLFCIEPKNKRFSPYLIYAALESTFGALQKELLGRSYGGGSGPIKVEGADISRILVPLWKGEKSHHLVEVVTTFASQPTRPLLEELGMRSWDDTPNPIPHRKALDDLIFDVLGLDQKERQAVYQETARLVWERTARAQSLGSIPWGNTEDVGLN